MSLKEAGIEHRQYGETLAATRRLTIQKRAELPPVIEQLVREVPGEAIAGPALVIYHFISSIDSGFDVEVCFPVTRPVETPQLRTRLIPAMEVLSLRHRGALDRVRESYAKLYGYTSTHGLVSDECGREVYLDLGDAAAGHADCEVELQFVVHNWNALLARHLERVVGAAGKEAVMQDGETVDLETPLDERFRWVRGALARLDGLASEGQKYDVLSSCAHVFPAEQVDKLRVVYQEARARTGDALQAVDEVIAFMDRDPGWVEGSRREGRIVYAAKKPRDPAAYAQAQTDAEKRRAYCFCPIIRNHLDQGMPRTFCYCGAGWYRRQWEGATGKPVTTEIVKSILNGDDVCQFAVHLPDDA
ncbi:MAG: GyrI-like domain-containing protein [Anaerolineae bacterium]|nr:GyrI-like domain-containing protein [Anaerolineae bacterium]